MELGSLSVNGKEAAFIVYHTNKAFHGPAHGLQNALIWPSTRVCYSTLLMPRSTRLFQPRIRFFKWNIEKDTCKRGLIGHQSMFFSLRSSQCSKKSNTDFFKPTICFPSALSLKASIATFTCIERWFEQPFLHFYTNLYSTSTTFQQNERW